MQGIDQMVDGGQGIFFRHIGEMSIASRCGGAGMAE
jgi:hypothetical protein